jgi:Methionyl-tRNA formyltransferase
LIDWTLTANEIAQRVRGFQPWPNAYTTVSSKGLTIWRAEPALSESNADCGEVLEARGDNLIVKCGGDTALRLIELQPEAKRRMAARDFLNGTKLKIGDRFGQT